MTKVNCDINEACASKYIENILNYITDNIERGNRRQRSWGDIRGKLTEQSPGANTCNIKASTCFYVVPPNPSPHTIEHCKNLLLKHLP